VTLQNPQLQSISDKPEQQLRLLTEVLAQCSTSLDIETTLQRVTEQVQHYLQADGVSVFMLENNGSELVCRFDASVCDIRGMRVPVDKGIVGRALRDGKTQLVRNVRNDPDFFPDIDQQTGTVTRSALAAPLRVMDNNIGVIEAINKSDGKGLFDDNDRELIGILATAASMAIQNARMAQRLVLQDRTQRELELARDIQAALLPRHCEDYPVFGLNVSARVVSGDFYDHFQREDGRVCFCLGDVSGKGINAALLMAKTSALFRCLGKNDVSPAQLLHTINNELHANTAHGMFVTMLAGLYDPDSGCVTLANAGHQPPLLYSESGQFSDHRPAAPPLGIVRDLQFDQHTLELQGRELYAFTDGLTECWMERGRVLGEDGVAEIIRDCAALPAPQRLAAIVERATQWKTTHSGYLYDDITILLVAPGPSD
jgi:sigma-B regulation protein RsbU (phosphoserine phosphatase)